MIPVGVFDSGVGGLTVVAALRRRLPGQPLVYLGDTARLPYGTKSGATVLRYTQRNLRFLLDRGVRAVVVACNTASAHALSDLDLAVPVWGVVEPGARRAAAVTSGRVGILATESTVRSGAYPRALRGLRPDVEVVSQACPLLVPLVEEGWHEDAVTTAVAERYLAPMRDSGVDTLVLGCTHYPLLAPLIGRLMGPGVTLVDSAESVAEEVARILAPGPVGEPAGTGSAHPPRHRFYVTDAAERFARIAALMLGEEVELELVDV